MSQVDTIPPESPHAVSPQVVNFIDEEFKALILDTLKSSEYWFEEKEKIHSILKLNLSINEKQQFLLYINPEMTTQDISNWERIYAFYIKYWFDTSIVENLQSVNLQGDTIQYLEENKFEFDDANKDDFFMTVILFLSGWEKSMLEPYIVSEQIIEQEKTSNSNTKMQSLGIIDFMKKVEILCKKKNIDFSVKEVKKWAKNFHIWNKTIINIGAWCASGRWVIQHLQQIKAIRAIGCTRAEWINA